MSIENEGLLYFHWLSGVVGTVQGSEEQCLIAGLPTGDITV